MEEYTNVTIACMKCRTKVPIKSMKYSKNGEDLVCANCYDAERGKITAKAQESLIRPMPASAGIKAKEATPQKISYECGKCGYKFARNREVIVNTCPYCNATELSRTESFGFYSV